MVRRAVYTVLSLCNKDGKSITELWSHDGKTGRHDGPAVLTRDIATGVVTCEKWFTDGRNLRKDGPAFIERDPSTGMVTLEMWFQRIDGDLDRTDGPALITMDRITGEVVESSWWRRGRLIRTPKAAQPLMLRARAPSPT
jgi:hypothetical protein